MDKRRRHRDPDVDADDDPLGKLLQHHQVSLAGVLILSGLLGLVGLGLLAYA